MSKGQPSGTGKKTASGIVAIGLILLFLYYLFTGSDPLGVFETDDTIAPSENYPSIPISSSTGSGGDWWQLYFTTPGGEYDPNNLDGSIPAVLIEYINDADDYIDIAAFEFNLTPVADALIAAHERGITVRWITDDEYGIDADFDDDGGQFEMLEDAGIEVIDDGRSALMHNKFIIFDGETVWTGSTNLTSNGSFRNNNNVIIVGDGDVATMYQREFDEMWDGEFGTTSPSTVSQQVTTIDGTQVQVLFAAEDDVIEALIPLIEGAEESIRFMAFSFTHDDLGTAVLERANDGVDVQGIFETRGSQTEYSEMTSLYCHSVDVRQDGNPGTFHHKVFIIDGKYVITGSLNFSDNANESNDENVIILNNSDIATEYLAEFDRRWAEATLPDAADMDCSR